MRSESKSERAGEQVENVQPSAIRTNSFHEPYCYGKRLGRNSLIRTERKLRSGSTEQMSNCQKLSCPAKAFFGIYTSRASLTERAFDC